jgi:hypothetical protein
VDGEAVLEADEAVPIAGEAALVTDKGVHIAGKAYSYGGGLSISYSMANYNNYNFQLERLNVHTFFC